MDTMLTTWCKPNFNIVNAGCAVTSSDLNKLWFESILFSKGPVSTCHLSQLTYMKLQGVFG